MNVGAMKHRVYILPYEEKLTAKGDIEKRYREIPTSPDIEPDDYAAIDTLKGRELIVAHGLRADLAYKITMRYRHDIKPGWRLGWVESEEPLITRTFELGPARNDGLENWEMGFYALEIL